MTQSIPQLPELLPCPFCGCGAQMLDSDPQDSRRHTIKCHDCPGGAEFFSSSAMQAVEAWNRRAALSRPLAVAAIPEGMALVPIEPTKEMLYAVQDNCDILPPRGKRVWAQFLGAAPQPPAGQQDRGEAPKKGLSVKDAMQCGICGESGVHYHTNHPDDETTTRRPVAHPFEVTDEIVEIVAREMERHSTADYEWTPEQFAIWWEKDEYCKREKVRAKARAGLLALSASPPPAPQREPGPEGGKQ